MKDPYTNEEFEPKRSNQKFANSRNRISYHNKIASKIRKEKAFIDKPLNANFKILNEIMQDKEESRFHEEFLRGKGYDPKIYNSTCKAGNDTGYCVYNYILIFKKPYVKIIRNN